MSAQVHSVSGITARIRDSLEGEYSGIWIEGEVSNHRRPGSGHHYFTLKDPFAQIACVFFKGSAMRNPVRIGDGMQIQVFGNVSVYEARGQYQLIVQTVQPKGFGDLQAKFEALKNRLEAEGLFDPERKKPIPSFPVTIGIVTSPTGAAIRDMINVLGRRAPWVRVLVYPVRVQGDGAAEEIAAAIRAFDEAKGVPPRPDLLIVARGGGSMEDLWAFNEEVVARAIDDCSLPVMSGVGHEIDFTIADFVADRREPTPSAAAENAVPDGITLRRHLSRLLGAVNARTDHALTLSRRHVDSLKREIEAREPGRRIQGWAQSLDYLGERMDTMVKGRLDRALGDLESGRRILNSLNPGRELVRSREQTDRLLHSLAQSMERAITERRHRLLRLGGLMQSLSPDAVLKRGYSITMDEKGELVRTAAEVKRGDRLRTRLSEGEVTSLAE